jgi:hypothetical protein
MHLLGRLINILIMRFEEFYFLVEHGREYLPRASASGVGAATTSTASAAERMYSG